MNMNVKKILKAGWKYIKDSDYRFLHRSDKGCYKRWSDEKFLKKKFKAALGKELDLDNPQTFNEKLQWLKLNNRKPEYTVMVDKYLVRDYVSSKIGEEHLIPLIGVWDDPDDIDFDALPDKFVLKCNHNSGTGMYICKDKSQMDEKRVKRDIRKGLQQNYYLTCREWPYKDVPRKIIAEQYMENGKGEDLVDYKFFCFNGEPKFVYISQGLSNHHTARISYVWLDWKPMPLQRTDYKQFEVLPPEPQKIDEMIKMSKVLSDDIPFARLDFYEIKGQVYFGEITLFPGGGFTEYSPQEWDKTLGDWLILPNK